MKKYTMETSVGIFVLIGLLCVAYLTIKLGRLEVFGADTYLLKARFSSVGGLRPGGSVEMAGVKVGSITRIYLDQETYMAMVDMQIERRIKLSEDTIASIKTSGLIGDKYVALSPGGLDESLAEGDIITETESALDIESLISKYAFGDVGGSKEEK
ncbi:outer membrane lipid asymmetry maintenance protein MlaD [Desulfocurvibacter africanus]|uniref:Mammalian cell entry related domain protein n=2 Tax=Desulfocurvibacter africanus TaxID=873 RepID=F3YTW7_DESAF|nr:outer membrane lipid asymmetry maintenance protein MlaD [Desulfocurvibacter africanus]EGJ48573.1 Mammalian cell entry related domain protein [Desulfocurvibacter africanus subsp. africanus str. Walvis Bay]EMG39100.1 ABC-type transport system involved in resistance to organic solvent, periplasmic component [Desulfocurvibacter africanus PCS]